MFDRARDSQAAARSARPYYQRAAELHREGCTLPRRPRYYQLMGEAYLALRLAHSDQGFDGTWLREAVGVLNRAQAEFPNSAEIPYNLARAHCGLAQVGNFDPPAASGGPSVPPPSSALGQCIDNFSLTLSVSLKQERPRFLRTHRSTEDWIVRSRTQSEFGPLRASPEYDEIVKKVDDLAPRRL